MPALAPSVTSFRFATRRAPVSLRSQGRKRSLSFSPHPFFTGEVARSDGGGERRPFVWQAVAVSFAVALGLTSAAHAETAAKIYDQNCSVCHQAGGMGMSGTYPRLAGRASAIASLPQGRRAMISAVLYGMAGSLTVDGNRIVGVMPPFSQLSDGDIAQVLTYVSHLSGGKPKAFTAGEVAAFRHPPLTSADTNGLAKDPALAKAAP